jgi:GntR family transcriptional repressor for pyruvate dehydrogenase complex
MLHMLRSMFDLLRDGVFYNRQVMFKNRMTREQLLDQHRAMNDAVQARDAVAARAAVEAHLTYVEQAFIDQMRTERHEIIARQKLEQEARR